ncbi:MAG: heme lyase CcmF/NrfE family subunit [Gammaproteobacteria bacterium]|nr:heme lyase CcmF/NrfE family subunit [Gammaproteobacteria bacterium]
MIPEIGNFSLIIALAVAFILAALPMIGAQRSNIQLMQFSRYAAATQFFFILVAFIALAYSFVIDDFSVLYVASNSNSALPMLFKISAVWGAHEGSLLLWLLILSTWTIAVAFFSKSLPISMTSRVLAVMGMLSIGFLLFVIFTSNPFERIFPVPLDGKDLNPLLQDFGLAIHPPMLYMGYVGFSVVFSITIAALITGQLDSAWARWSRPWTVIAWAFLTVGIALGSWWAYYELGWGGWWFWDPVENASFMPWLVGTALVHSLMVTEKRGAFKSWTVLLALMAFSLSLLGTFLVRSGVLVSVHAFASDPTRGAFILAFLVLVIGSSLMLYAIRGTAMGGGGSFNLFSRDTFMLLGNILLTVACAMVLLGTLYPLLDQMIDLGKLSVGEPYFNTVFVPIMLPALVFMSMAPLMRWKGDSFAHVAKQMLIPVTIAALVGISLLFIENGSVMISVSIGLAAMIALSVIVSFVKRLRNKANIGEALKKIPLSVYGMSLAHMGVAVFIVGVTFTESMSLQKDLRMGVGDTISLGDYSFTFEGAKTRQGPNYTAHEGAVSVINPAGEPVAVLTPQKRIYQVRNMPMTEAGIDAGLFRDLFVALAEQLDNGAWSLRIYYKPFIRWIWLGCLFMALGGVIAIMDKRYRLKVTHQKVVPA